MAKFSLEQVNDQYFDVLKEIGNIGAGNATTAISNMLSIKVNMDVPKVEFLRLLALKRRLWLGFTWKWRATSVEV